MPAGIRREERWSVDSLYKPIDSMPIITRNGS